MLGALMATRVRYLATIRQVRCLHIMHCWPWYRQEARVRHAYTLINMCTGIEGMVQDYHTKWYYIHSCKFMFIKKVIIFMARYST